jgi:hypothetical protein
MVILDNSYFAGAGGAGLLLRDKPDYDVVSS